MRVWDGFMVDGIPFIYKSALAFLKITREKILKADVSETMSILHFEKGIMDDIDPSYFIEVANRFKLKSDVNPVKAMDEVIEPESP